MLVDAATLSLVPESQIFTVKTNSIKIKANYTKSRKSKKEFVIKTQGQPNKVKYKMFQMTKS